MSEYATYILATTCQLRSEPRSLFDSDLRDGHHAGRVHHPPYLRSCPGGACRRRIGRCAVHLRPGRGSQRKSKELEVVTSTNLDLVALPEYLLERSTVDNADMGLIAALITTARVGRGGCVLLKLQTRLSLSSVDTEADSLRRRYDSPPAATLVRYRPKSIRSDALRRSSSMKSGWS